MPTLNPDVNPDAFGSDEESYALAYDAQIEGGEPEASAAVVVRVENIVDTSERAASRFTTATYTIADYATAIKVASAEVTRTRCVLLPSATAQTFQIASSRNEVQSSASSYLLPGMVLAVLATCDVWVMVPAGAVLPATISVLQEFKRL